MQPAERLQQNLHAGIGLAAARRAGNEHVPVEGYGRDRHRTQITTQLILQGADGDCVGLRCRYRERELTVLAHRQPGDLPLGRRHQH